MDVDDDGVDVTVEEEYLPVNQDPSIIDYYSQAVVEFGSTYGWLLLGGLCVLYYLYIKLRPSVTSYLDAAATATHKKMDSSEIERRQLSMEAHRRKLQDEHDRKTAEYAARQSELEQKKRQEKLEDWDRHQSGLGYKSKVKKAADSSSNSATLTSKSKKKLRDPDYSPLGGGSDGPSSSWRPARRGPAAGGG